MFRRPHYLNIPWDLPGRHDAGTRHHWWFVAALIAAVLLLIGVRATGGFWIMR
jgi:hypothetical protein